MATAPTAAAAAAAPRFGARTTAEEVMAAYKDHAAGRVVLITGANTGLGYETARSLAAAGAHVFVACRSQANADATCDKIRALSPDAKVDGLQLQLDSLASVRECAEAFLAKNLPLHILINNAGIMATPRGYTKDGFEQQFGVNHLGHFYLTNLLLDKIKASAPARIVNLSSMGHYLFAPRTGINFDDLDGKRSYWAYERYAQSKLANVLHAKELQRHMDAEGVDVTCVALHPGSVLGTELVWRKGTYSVLGILPYVFNGRLFRTETHSKTNSQGASTSLVCALQPDVVKGGYYADCNPENKGRTNPLVNDVALAKRLWDVSVELVNQALTKLAEAAAKSSDAKPTDAPAAIADVKPVDEPVTKPAAEPVAKAEAPALAVDEAAAKIDAPAADVPEPAVDEAAAKVDAPAADVPAPAVDEATAKVDASAADVPAPAVDDATAKVDASAPEVHAPATTSADAPAVDEPAVEESADSTNAEADAPAPAELS